jgi:type IV pilus assembly protein PilV
MATQLQRSQHGFSLIEALVSLVVVSVGMIGIASLYGQGLGAGRTALFRTQAVNLAADMADRIRVNRLGLGNFDGAGADNGCDPTGGGGVDCTPAEMAAHDVWSWSEAVSNQLPNGEGTVDFVAGTPPSYTIQISWQEVGLGTITHQIVVQIPNI